MPSYDPAYQPVPPQFPQPPVAPPPSNPGSGSGGFTLIEGTSGNDELAATDNQDAFLFRSGNGVDLVYDFDPSDTGDVIAIEAGVNGSGVQAVEQLWMADTEYGTLIDLGGGNGLLLVDVAMSELDPSDFAIVPPGFGLTG